MRSVSCHRRSMSMNKESILLNDIPKDWGVRKYKDLLNQPIKLEYELLNETLKNPSFESVR